PLPSGAGWRSGHPEARPPPRAHTVGLRRPRDHVIGLVSSARLEATSPVKGPGETMGLFDIFGDREQRAIKKHAGRVANKRSQSPERWESIQALGQMKSREAVEALLVRFNFRIEPSISDQE